MSMLLEAGKLWDGQQWIEQPLPYGVTPRPYGRKMRPVAFQRPESFLLASRFEFADFHASHSSYNPAMLQTIADWLGTHRDELIVGVVLLAVGVIGAWLSGLGKILWRKLFMCNDTAPAPTVVVQPIQIVKEADRQLDIRPGIRPAMEDPGNVTKWVLFAEIRAIDKEAHVRDAYIETSDHIKLRPCWATHRTSGWAVAAETVFTIPAGETLTIYFGVHVKEGRGKVVAPDYYHAPWGHTSTATHVVVRTIDGDHASIANSPVRELADAVARYRSSHGRVNNASATFKSGGTITHVRR